MGLLSSAVSITRYKVEGELEEPVLENIAKGLKENAIMDIDDEVSEKASGWTSFEDSFKPDFEGSSFSIGTHLVFSLRIDKKTIPAKVIKKKYNEEMAKRLAETGREKLSRNEKQGIKEAVISNLSLRIPAVPNTYDIIWNYEDRDVWFLSTQKAANEELETLFSKSFKLTLIRLFPYTIAELTAGLSEPDREILSNLSQTSFTE